MRPCLILVFVVLLGGGVFAQGDWIHYDGVPARAYGVFHFRKTFSLSSVPSPFIVHVSADNRYRLFVNGQSVCTGPARGDLAHWNLETVDIAPWLHAGVNTLAALVWNMGEYAPVAQISNQTGFLLEGPSVGTGPSWRVLYDSAFSPCSLDNGQRLHTYMVVGPGDHVVGSAYPWGWEQPGYPDSTWPHATVVSSAVMYGNGSDNLWTLVPRSIPLFPEKMQRLSHVRRFPAGFDTSFLHGGHPVVIPPGQRVSILLDQGFETLGYPSLLVSGGAGASVRVSYAEALFDSSGHKGNRDSIAGKTLVGNYDVFEPDGGASRLFRPLWTRTYRYVQLDITTAGSALSLDDFYGMHTGYPFLRWATFSCNDNSLNPIWEVGWRTALLCAGETYFDCPYYEQLQYEGDTRIQSLISLYMTGDDRLMRKAIMDFNNSRVPEGLTQGRYPSNRLQVIPPFSLFWVSMLHDYWMHRPDTSFISSLLLPASEVLYWYEKHIDPAVGMLGPMDWWSFVDWNDAFPGGIPDGATDGHSAVVTLQFANTLLQAADLFAYFGRVSEAAHYRALAASLNSSVYRACFSSARHLMANTPSLSSFSQHASILGVLSGAIPPSEAPVVMQHVLSDSSVSQATFYYRFYLTRALCKAGMADLYYSQLGPWRNMLALGLTTFAEKPEPTRSDCHAWSASPLYDFLATICGIMPDAPGFSRVLIKPALGPLHSVNAMMPHPRGDISVHLQRVLPSGIKGEITLPSGVGGRFVWEGKEVLLHEGRQEVRL